MRRRTTMPSHSIFWFSLCLCLSVVGSSVAADWTHWRGPLQSGYSPEKNLPDDWDPRTVGKNNLVWKQPYACRSTPLVMNRRVYIIGAENEPPGVPTLKEKPFIGERVACFDAAKGTKVWEKNFNVFHSDIVANRLGWAPLAGDPAAKRIYAHTTGGHLFSFDAENGNIVWQRQLTEEFGRFTGYGGRVGGGPVFDSGMVFVGIVNSSWGDKAIGTNRLYAFDGKDGKVVWIAEVPNPFRSNTYYSNPVFAVINGQRLLITGGADGALTAYQVRTGKVVWTHVCAAAVINPSPVVDGNLVYISHGEENPGGGEIGRVVCVDASQVINGRPKLVWEYKRGIRFGLASLAIADGKLYVPDDGAKLFCFDAKKGGNPKWKYNYGTTSRGAPVIADGKIYLSETIGRFHIIKLKEDGSQPDDLETHTVNFRPKKGAEGTFVESNSTPSIADGRVYLATRDELYCIATKDAKPFTDTVKAPVEMGAAKSALAHVQLVPAEVTLRPGESAEFEMRLFDASGMPLPGIAGKVEWSLPVPPLPKGAKDPPPALDATIDAATGKITVNPKKPAQQGYVEVKVGNVTGRARVRVAAQVPYQQDFEKVPIGAVPGGWINAQGKFRIVEHKEADGTMAKVLFKINTDPRPPLTRALAYITPPDSTGYTIEADLKGVAVRQKLGDMGICANRYLLILDGKPNENGKREARLTTWEALPTPLPAGRVAVESEFDWKSGVWYRAKLTVEVVGEKEAVVRGKVWERGQKEPEKWTLELKDPRPNREGAAALYGYVSNAVSTEEPGSEIYFDNVTVMPNGKK